MIGHKAEVLAAVAARVDRELLTTQLLARFGSEIGGYADLEEPLLREQIESILRRNIELCLRWVGAGQEPDDADLAPFRASARRRAAEGLPLEDLLQAYRLGGKAGWRALVETATPDERDALPDAAELVMDYIDRVSAAVAQAYLLEREDVVARDAREARSLLHALTRSDRPLDAADRTAAERLLFPLRPRCRPFAVRLAPGGAAARGFVPALRQTPGVLAVPGTDRVEGLLSDPQTPLPAVPAGATFAVGREASRTELADALDDARLAATLAHRLGREGVVHVDDLGLELLLARDPRGAGAVADRTFGPLDRLDAHARDTLLATVDAYIACDLDRRAAAERLHVHPNTVDYRLGRIQEIAGLDLGSSRDIALAVLALRHRALEARSAGTS